MLNNLKTNKILWTITTAFALATALIGVLFPHIYDQVFAPQFIPGAWPQDLLTVLICISLLVLIGTTKENNAKKQIIIIGIISSFFYLYGIFTIERVYNNFYILYAAIFATSFWSVTYSLMNLKKEFLIKISLSSSMIKTSSIIGIIIGLIFSGLWIAALIPLMRDNNRIEYLYSIYILDLCFIMPAFFITGIMELQKKSLGIVLSPVIFILGFFVIFPLGLGEIAKPFYDQSINYGAMAMSFIFAILMLLVAGLQIKKIKISN